MIDHVLGRPSTKSRRLQVLAVLSFWSFYLVRGHKHGPPVVRSLSKLSTRALTTWQTVVVTMIYLYAARNFSTLVGLASPDPMSNMYDAAYFRATWVLTALDAGFWTAMKIRTKWLRELSSMVFSVFYLFAAELADEKVRKVRGTLTVEHLRVAWNKGTTPYLQFVQGLLRPRFTRWPPRAIRIPRPSKSDYKDPVSAWLYYDGPLTDLEHHDKVVVDIPGGGFVAMDPRCNDDKLFSWAAKTGLPILAIDYKKAPEFPYPYAINECLDVYTTIIKSRGRCIGMSGREVPKVVFTGDSAGGNIATATTLMIIERATGLVGRQTLPIPDGLILFYPALDMNIGNWMSEEQMSLIRDKRMRGTNKPIVRRKSRQYNDLVGTPHHSDDEDETSSPPRTGSDPTPDQEADISSSRTLRSPHPEYAHGGPPTLSNGGRPSADASANVDSTSHHPKLLRTRLAVSSMLSYFNDRVLTPEMMRAMIILYIGAHNRPDFAKDYLLSPVLAPDELLSHFPKTYFLTGERDPLVDDTVIFAGRLRRAKEALFNQTEAGTRNAGRMGAAESIFNSKDVAEVMLIPGISHGFLQFPTLYRPAWKLMERAARWIDDAFTDADAKRERELWSRRRRVSASRAYEQARPHSRAESSGDEDRPLEMGMTRANKGKAIVPNGKANGFEVGVDDSVQARAEAVMTDRRKSSGRTKSGASSFVKLSSSEDLLGRRMRGLANGLTGVGEDD